MKFLDFGSLNIDHVYQLTHFVRAGETVASEKYAKNEGGKGFNQAVALAKAGMETYFAGAIGEDGQFLKKYLEETGVHTGFLRTLTVPTGHAIIQVNEEGQNSIILYGGANRCISPEMIDETLSEFGEGDYVLLQNEISNVPYIIEKAKERGMTVVLNPSPVSKDMLSWPLDKVDIFLMNEIEGEDITAEAEPQKMLDVMLERYPDCRVVLTLGLQGSVYAERGKRITQEAFKVQAVDTTAAGDTFTGFFLTALLSGKPVEEALKTASKASAISVSRKGAGRSIPYANEL